MCGIAGIIDPVLTSDESAIEAMIADITYRGPDAAGRICLQPDGIALGHRRLSILDLSDAARQPMASADGRYWIVYNGELYNYLEIREQLEGLGWQFKSASDTEVLLVAYQEWGAACLDRCMGMYAFAIWDRVERRLFAARDRLGIKPLYYRQTARGLLFASEIKSILAVSEQRGIDASLIDAYMTFGYVPGADTLHHGIRRLLPGHTLTWQDNATTVTSYWDLDFGAPLDEPLERHAEDVRTMLRESIALHLRSDVPLGVFLSGGLDSSAVVALLSRSKTQGLNTFSVAYDFGPEYDETPYARLIAKSFGTDHHEIRVTPKQFLAFLPQFVWHMDEPVTEAAAISLYFVSKLAREHVVVCLSGEGSDELFGGYDFYSYNLIIERLQSMLGLRVFSAFARLAPVGGKTQKYLSMAGKPLSGRYRGISTYEEAKRRNLYTSDFALAAEHGNEGCRAFLEALFARSRGWDPLSRMLYFDTKTWLVDDLLIKADRMSMAASIELRVPFLDHRLAERAASIPAQQKVYRGRTKIVLKRALQNLLPDTIINRRKMGFPTPLELMFRGELFDYARDLLLSRRAVDRGYFDQGEVQKMLTEHHRGRAKHDRELWQLVVLEEWHRAFGY